MQSQLESQTSTITDFWAKTVNYPLYGKYDEKHSYRICWLVRGLLIFLVEVVTNNFKAPAKRSQHANTTYRNIVGRNMLRTFGHLVATCCNILGVVGSNLTIFKLEPTTPNMLNTSQHGGQTHATCCAQQCCVDMLRSFGQGLKRTTSQRNRSHHCCAQHVAWV